jgi:hypothetical protein
MGGSNRRTAVRSTGCVHSTVTAPTVPRTASDHATVGSVIGSTARCRLFPYPPPTAFQTSAGVSCTVSSDVGGFPSGSSGTYNWVP